MKRFTVFSAAVLVILSLTAAAVSAIDVPKAAEVFYVADYAGVMTADTVDYIVEKNSVLYSETGAQIVIVTVGGLGGESISRYANSIFNEWGVGSAEKNNGILLLMSIGDDDYWVTQGKGLENSISSGLLGNMLDEYLEPYFAVGEYDEGAKSFFDAVYNAVVKLYVSNGNNEKTDGNESIIGKLAGFIGRIGIVGVFLVIVIIYIMFSVLGSVSRKIGRITSLPRMTGGGFSGLGRGYVRSYRPPRTERFRGKSSHRSSSFGSGSSRGGSHHGGGGSSRGGGAGRGRR